MYIPTPFNKIMYEENLIIPPSEYTPTSVFELKYTYPNKIFNRYAVARSYEYPYQFVANKKYKIDLRFTGDVMRSAAGIYWVSLQNTPQIIINSVSSVTFSKQTQSIKIAENTALSSYVITKDIEFTCTINSLYIGICIIENENSDVLGNAFIYNIYYLG